MADAPTTINITAAPLLVSDEIAAELCGVSRSHWQKLEASGAIGPQPVRCLGARKLWRVAELSDWCAGGCVPREKWRREAQP